ncbi:DUF429 domain-containing protein [Xanthomonas cerealis]|uniref:DUF429 domain-containing protein n=1 Tax=Xanthomonas cerealis TaxID=3390025 RepID=UPI0009B862DF|nr:DUF429 domain-containing protein [Xanthomonas translucens]UKE47618.1 DUF429 domain-containing protein [Xanthomonas translucens pv. cerealis]
MNQFVGIDPGGLSAMGWCVMTVRDADVRLDTGICTGAETCINLIASCVDRLPVAVGIDAPLYWAYDGDRVSDRRIRAAVASVGGSGGTINHVNSLRAACLVQGILAAVAIAQRWPSTRVTESHPKALLRIWPEANAFVSKHTFRTDHERDAALGAYAAKAYYEQSPGWVDWIARENNVFLPSGRPVAYWFPECPEDRRRS